MNKLLNGIFALSTGVPGQGIFGVVIALIILIYLFADRNVRAAFRTGI
ncbi:MAG TPA: hypothetical protein VNG51_24740 [Ktedonobacteraceae bacterium]|nr:hypothetical protein [Ktedonobacteraceae bacterium]